MSGDSWENPVYCSDSLSWRPYYTRAIPVALDQRERYYSVWTNFYTDSMRIDPKFWLPARYMVDNLESYMAIRDPRSRTYCYTEGTGRLRHTYNPNMQIGYSCPGPDPFTLYKQITLKNSLARIPSEVGTTAGTIMSCVGSALSDDCMKEAENAELKREGEAIRAKAKYISEQLDALARNELNLSPEVIYTRVKFLQKLIDGDPNAEDENAKLGLDKRMQEFSKKYDEARRAYLERQAQEAEAAAQAEAEAAEHPETEEEHPTAEETDNDGDDSADESVDDGHDDPPPVQTSAKKEEVVANGTKVKVVAKDAEDNDDNQLSGKYYEYNGKIYKVTDSKAEPEDVTDKVKKRATPAT